jgi:hypothetical protein
MPPFWKKPVLNPHFMRVRESIEEDLSIPFLKHMFRQSVLAGEPDIILVLIISDRQKLADKRFKQIPF